MSKTKISLIIIGVLSLTLAIWSAFKTGKYTVNTNTKINAPAIFVYNALNDLSNQQEINPFKLNDTSFQVSCADKVSGMGSFCDYSGKKSSQGIIRILYNTPTDSIAIVQEPKSGRPYLFSYKISKSENLWTDVDVNASGQAGWISNLWNFIHKWRLKSKVNSQLDKLKNITEARYNEKIYGGFKVESVSTKKNYYMVEKGEVNLNDTEPYYTQNISRLYQLALDNNIIVEGSPAAFYYNWDKINNKTRMAAALQTLSQAFVTGVMTDSLPVATALKVEYTGQKSGLYKVHTAIINYILDHSIEYSYPVVEEYLTSPSEEQNPDNWVTNVYYYTKNN